jgi:hypothetical protein
MTEGALHASSLSQTAHAAQVTLTEPFNPLNGRDEASTDGSKFASKAPIETHCDNRSRAGPPRGDRSGDVQRHRSRAVQR